MRVLVAPDKFRGTITAAQAARAIAAGWRSARPDDEIEEVPLADGGEGTLDVLVEAFAGERRTEIVMGPLGDPTEAEYALIPRNEELLAVVEISRASGAT
jgi:glycerate kinase